MRTCSTPTVACGTTLNCITDSPIQAIQTRHNMLHGYKLVWHPWSFHLHRKRATGTGPARGLGAHFKWAFVSMSPQSRTSRESFVDHLLGQVQPSSQRGSQAHVGHYDDKVGSELPGIYVDVLVRNAEMSWVDGGLCRSCFVNSCDGH